MITECSSVKDMIYDRTNESFCPCERCFLIQERRLIKSVSNLKSNFVIYYCVICISYYIYFIHLTILIEI